MYISYIFLGTVAYVSVFLLSPLARTKNTDTDTDTEALWSNSSHQHVHEL